MPTILDRLRPTTRDAARDASRAIDDVTSAIEDVTSAIGDRADDAAATVSAAAEATADRASDLAGTIARRIADATEDLDGTLREAKAKVADGVTLEEVSRRLERHWPGTDTDRYDRAFERGYARGRSGRLAIGLGLGAVGAAAGVYLFDPDRGAIRRAMLTARIRQQARAVQEWMADRRQELAAQRAASEPDMTASSSFFSGEPGSSISTSAPVAVGPGHPTDADPDLRTPVAAGSIAAEGHDAERGDWHRDLPPGQG